MSRWDIFCKVVDNFGDIGVCWRLAQQLQAEHGLQVRLIVDDLVVAKKIISSLAIEKNLQVIENITFLKWQTNTDFGQTADVVIEAFACGLPAQYLTVLECQKSTQRTVWVNLEYLSAENWVCDFHAKSSPQANGLTRHFYFPGFTPTTGGLLREKNAFVQPIKSKYSKTELTISLFCYAHAPIKDLFFALQTCQQAVKVYVLDRKIYLQVADFFGKNQVSTGEKLSRNNLTVEILPFLSQAEYDILLRSCDINFVRGEDSWLRAIWAGKPFIWQPYFQTEETHLLKLNAFLVMFYQETDFAISKPLSMQNLRHLHTAWANNQAISAQMWQQYLQDLPQIASHTSLQSKNLVNQPDLATQLVNFCNIN